MTLDLKGNYIDASPGSLASQVLAGLRTNGTLVDLAPQLFEDPSSLVPDPHLRAILHASSGVAYNHVITANNLRSVSSLVVPEFIDAQLVNRLDGLHLAVNLNRLLMRWPNVTDIRPLSGLRGLRQLDLFEMTKVEDWTPISSLSGLTRLQIARCNMQTIPPLAGLTNLFDLELDSNMIADITALSSLPRLVSLDLDNNQISNLAPLGSLKNLGLLDFAHNKVRSLAPLASLNNLGSLDFNDNLVVNLEPITGLTNLHSIDAKRNNILDFSPIIRLLNKIKSRPIPWIDKILVTGNFIPRLPEGIQGRTDFELPQRTFKLTHTSELGGMKLAWEGVSGLEFAIHSRSTVASATSTLIHTVPGVDGPMSYKESTSSGNGFLYLEVKEAP